MSSELEDLLAKVNRNVFLREYTFATNKFKSESGQEYELADHVVLLPGRILVFQVKERDESADHSDESIVKWFKREVLKKACKQLADTRTFLESEPNLVLPNQRGHMLDLAGPEAQVVQVALYASGQNRPPFLAQTSHRVSNRAGFVHILHVRDYYEMCRALSLPGEIGAYFPFREDYLLRNALRAYHEARIVAAFVEGDPTASLDDDAVRSMVADAVSDVRSFDLGDLLQKYGDKVEYAEAGGSGTDYYAILNEFARMNRVHRRAFRQLLDWASGKAGGDGHSFEIPARMRVPGRDIGFVVFPVPKGAHDYRLNALHNYTLAMKHDWKLPRAIGVAVSRVGGKVEIDWAFVEFPWRDDPDMDRRLAANYPFRSTPEPRMDYRFRQRSQE